MTRRRSPPKATGDTSTLGAQGFDEGAFWKKIAKLPARASSRLIHQALLLYCLLTDKSTPAWVRALIVVALVYLINPFDLVPDALPGVGLADDAAAIALLLHRLAAYVTPALEARASKLVPWGSKTSGDSEASTTNKKPRNRKGTPREEHTQQEGQ
jgi:uncharacterized membrane protein YkvA (DUF1232 family)